MFETVQPQYEAELSYRREQLRKGVAVRRRNQRLKLRRGRKMDSVVES